MNDYRNANAARFRDLDSKLERITGPNDHANITARPSRPLPSASAKPTHLSKLRYSIGIIGVSLEKALAASRLCPLHPLPLGLDRSFPLHLHLPAFSRTPCRAHYSGLLRLLPPWGECGAISPSTGHRHDVVRT
ncbi:hypothetical protein MPH_10462 [Macrophomina phaseolina MS6]|uniref:Uncharacterized protein n=1 Tax=Macrophomina phaseolina (strain MS6) TaxID=1126212 RepID=K2S6E5_MACPH|nr:hypothetical protein MPH_10462 [Macrophomina phaseolina MS6]